MPPGFLIPSLLILNVPTLSLPATLEFPVLLIQPDFLWFSKKNLYSTEIILTLTCISVLTQFPLFEILSDLHILLLIRVFPILQSLPQFPSFSVILSQRDLTSFELMVFVGSALD